MAKEFLSTLSLRRATTLIPALADPAAFLSTLSLRRATCHHMSKNAAIGFLSTLSLRRATDVVAGAVLDYRISIHALLAESDGESAAGAAAWA